MKKYLTILLALAIIISCTYACAQTPYKVGVIHLVTHEAGEKATQGFIDTLTAGLGEANVQINVQSASGDYSVCASIINAFAADEVDLIMANGTPTLQAASNIDDIPILGTCVTDYAAALGIEAFTGTVGGNISGTCDLAPLDQQADMILTLFPETANVGILYCSAEANSLYQVSKVRSYLEAKDVNVITFPFADSNELAFVLQTACESIDVLYIPTDNTVAANAVIVNNICQPAGIPVITGDTGTCRAAGAAVLGIDYYELGAATGRMAVQVLEGQANIAQMPIIYADAVCPQYNPEICEALGITVPDGYIPLETEE